MITAHHNRIEQLRESFKSKMNEADAWPAKVRVTAITSAVALVVVALVVVCRRRRRRHGVHTVW